jgi:two-component system sensor histidine kinase/response regulator
VTNARGHWSAPAIPDLPGIDVGIAVAYCEGNLTLFRELLNLLERGHATDADKVRQLVLRGESQEARRIAHSLKGAAGQIGAMELARAAAALESVLGQHPRRVPERLLARIEALMGELLGSIERLKPHLPRTVRSKARGSGYLEPQELAARCAELASLIDDDLAGALDLIDRLEASEVDPAFAGALRTLGAALRAYELEAARAHTGVLLRTLASRS